MFSLWHHIGIALSVSVSQLLIVPPAASGQTTSTDTTASAPSDSLVAPGDSLAAGGDSASMARADTVDTIPRAGSDSVSDSIPPFGTSDTAAGRSDTARSTSDSAPEAATRDSARRPASRSPPAPVDSVLSAACGGPSGSATIARDLLVVVFAAEAGSAERVAAAESVGGRLLGSAEPGAYYLRLTAEGGEAGLRAATDRLSQLAQVRQVGSRACPSLIPAGRAPGPG